MFSWSDFAGLAPEICGVTIDPEVAGPPDRGYLNQQLVVQAPIEQSLFVIAGPGSGKTTSATLRLLKLIYVDGLAPEAVFATTFTRKAAAVLRSRVTAWGEAYRDRLSELFPDHRAWLDHLDLNKLRTGTLDSLAQDILNDHKRAGDDRPSPVEEHILTNIMLTRGIFPTASSTRGAASNDVAAFLRPIFPRFWNSDPGRAEALIQVRQRLVNDQVDREAVRQAVDVDNAAGRGTVAALDSIEVFEANLRDREIYDFSSINEAFLHALRSGRLDDFVQGLRYVIVDEYQDTNYLQELIYFELAQAAHANGGSIMVVGDDDQSLYRFRGATVELFAGYEERLRGRLGVVPQRITLDRNFRSTQPIVNLVNEYVNNDDSYQAARVDGKPGLIHGGTNNRLYPILGLFRDSETDVANAIARLIAKLCAGEALEIRDHEGNLHSIQLEAELGSAGDFAVLTYSANEYGQRQADGRQGRERLPLKLRNALAAETPIVSVFNPRGRPLRDIPSVQELLGNLIDCLDPEDAVLDAIQERYDADGNFRPRYVANATCLTQWRNVARQERARRGGELATFVQNWAGRHATRRIIRATRVSTNDLIFKLIKWIPEFQYDIEHLAWLEAIQRAVSASAVLQGFGGDIVFDPREPDSELARVSVKHVYERILFPIAEDIIRVSEEMLETLPLDRVNLMTIHQSKGLEFPVTIVDIGTALEDLRWQRPNTRFPASADSVHLLEDYFRVYSDIGLADRAALDRAFDDLIRNYFVAFSRAQDLLILTGHTNAMRRRRRGVEARHVGAGWLRDGSWPWEGMPNVCMIEDQDLWQ